MKKKIIWSIVWIVLIWTLSYFWYDYHKNNWTKYEYYDDGTIQYKYVLKNWELNWESIAYYPDWQIEFIQNWENDDRNWERTYYYKNWNLREHYFMKKWYEDFSKESIGYYSNKQIKWHRDLDDKYTDYFVNGQVGTVWKYNLSWQKIWEWNQYDETWKHIATLIYNDWKPYSWNIYEYLYRFFDEDESEEILLNKIKNYKEWELNWPQYEYYENGNLKKIENYKNWKEDWKQTEYTEDWTIKEERMYRNWDLNWRNVMYDKSWNIIAIYKRKDWEMVDSQRYK